MASKRTARVDLTLDKDRFDRGLDSASSRMRKFARDGKRSLGDLDKSTSKMMGEIGAAIGRKGLSAVKFGLAGVGAAAAIGGIGLVSMADDALTLEKGLTRYQIATDASDTAMSKFREGLAKVARASGINRQELLSGASAYVALTGDAAGAAAGMELFAKVSNASGASMADIAATAAAMKDNLGIDPSDFEAGFSALVVQGKAGAVELRELATELAGVAPSFAAFKGGGGVQGLVEMGAALQVVRKGFGSSSEGATGFRALMVSMQRNAGKFEKSGVKIFDKNPKTGKKRLRDFSDIVDAIARSKLAKDPTLLTKAFGSDEAKRAYDQLVKNRALFDDLQTKGGDKGAVERDAATYLASPAARVTKAWEAVKQAMAEAFTPERITAFATALEHVAKTTADVINGIEVLANLMGGGESRLLAAGVQGRFAGRVAAAGGAAIPHMPDFKTANKGTTTGDSGGVVGVLAGVEDMGRAFSGRSRDRDLGAGIGFIAKAMQAALRGATPGAFNVAIKIGTDEIARAQANAPAQRTMPGGV